MYLGFAGIVLRSDTNRVPGRCQWDEGSQPVGVPEVAERMFQILSIYRKDVVGMADVGFESVPELYVALRGKLDELSPSEKERATEMGLLSYRR